jgi:flagellar M-ring protein FliF
VLARLPPSLPRVAEECAIWIYARRRPVLAAACAAAIVALLGIVVAHSEAPVPLFDAPLHPAQTAEVAQALTLWNEPFTADSRATQIFVASRRRRDLLVRLALADLPHGYVPTTADVLQTQDNPLAPPEVVDDRRRAGIEGDFVAGLRRIEGVADATVVIAPATGDSFADEAQRSPPSASVQLILQSGAQLSQSAIAGIRRFVAAGYPGLNPDRVAVVDGSGAMLGAAPDRATGREARIQSNVQSALDAALGAGAAIVRVSMRSAASEQTTQSTRVVPHGLLDADTGRETGSENGRKLSKERTTRHYAYDTIVERRTTAADALVRMSVAVFLDSGRVDASKRQAISSLVRAAAGADLSAGDDVVVESVPFAPHAPPVVAAARAPLARAVLPAAAVALVAVALGFTLWPQRVHKNPDPIVSGVRRSLDRESPRTAAFILSTLPRATRDQILDSYGPARRATIEACLYEQRKI